MFAKGTEKLVQKIVQLEYDNAVKHWGATYKDENEAREVLVEEMQEAKDDIWYIFDTYGLYGMGNIKGVEISAMHAMKELAQVCAVCRKIKKSKKEWKK